MIERVKSILGAKTHHYVNVERFMQMARQDVPLKPTVPTVEVRLLRAKLIFEEAMETIYKGLGVVVAADSSNLFKYPPEFTTLEYNELTEEHVELPFNMVETVDGCADVKVVTTGTLIAIGVPDHAIQEEVDYNNLDKFGPGHSWREDGKLNKPPGHPKPDLAGVLAGQGWEEPTCQD